MGLSPFSASGGSDQRQPGVAILGGRIATTSPLTARSPSLAHPRDGCGPSAFMAKPGWPADGTTPKQLGSVPEIGDGVARGCAGVELLSVPLPKGVLGDWQPSSDVRTMVVMRHKARRLKYITVACPRVSAETAATHVEGMASAAQIELIAASLSDVSLLSSSVNEDCSQTTCLSCAVIIAAVK